MQVRQINKNMKALHFFLNKLCFTYYYYNCMIMKHLRKTMWTYGLRQFTGWLYGKDFFNRLHRHYKDEGEFLRKTYKDNVLMDEDLILGQPMNHAIGVEAFGALYLSILIISLIKRMFKGIAFLENITYELISIIILGYIIILILTPSDENRAAHFRYFHKHNPTQDCWWNVFAVLVAVGNWGLLLPIMIMLFEN